MFASNQKLSVRGIQRMIFSQSIGLCCLFSVYFALHFGFVTTLLLCIAILLLTNAYAAVPKHFLVKLRGFLKSFLFLIFGILFLVKYVHENLLLGTNTFFLLLVIFLTALPVSFGTQEERGRLAIFLAPVLFAALILSLLLMVCSIDFFHAGTLLQHLFTIPYPCNARNLLKLCLVALFTSLVLCPAVPDIKAAPFFRCSLFTFTLSMILALLACLTEVRQPVITIIFSLLFYIFTCMHHCRLPLSKTKRTRNFFPVLAFFLSVLFLLLPTVLSSHYLTFLSGWNFKTLYSSEDTWIDGKELEERSFILSLYLHEKEGCPVYTCQVMDFQEDAVSWHYVTLSDFEIYESFGNHAPDFSFLKGILSDGSSDSQNLLASLKRDFRIPDHVPVFTQEEIPQAYAYFSENIGRINLGDCLENLSSKSSGRAFNKSLIE